LPRLTYQRVVLAPATWHLDAADWQPLLAAPPADFMACLAAFRQQWQLPRHYALADGDNELLIDADNELLARVWLDAIRQRPHIELREYLLEPAASPVHDAAGRPFAQQFIALLVRQEACYPAAQTRVAPAVAPTPVQREFALGSEWLYYKLYCGQKVADWLLLDIIGPLTQALRAQGLLDNWFFIRYADPDNHLRLRLHLPDPARTGEVIALMHDYLAPARANGSVWNVQADTYRRELPRYGARTIAASEALFGYQSEALLAQLAAQADDPAPDAWPWGLTAIEELLRAFDYPLARKVALLQRLKEAFAHEFGVDKTLRRQLDAKYRQARPAIEQALARAAGPPPASLCALVAPIVQAARQGQLEMELEDLLASYLHMLLNRLLPAEARLHELVLYDFLFRAYQSQLARLPR
jgi:thiopeptide-type bacteriocin biosynthesis protein